MALTNAQRQAQWRQRQKESQGKYDKYRQNEKERYERKKSRGVVKLIAQMNEREQRSKRRQWKKNQQSKRQRDNSILESIRNTLSPPTSPENYQQQVARDVGRKRVRRDRAKAYREIFKLRVALKKEERLKEKYKKRSQRLAHKLNTDETNHEEKIIKNHELRKSILFYHTIAENVRRRYKQSKSYKERKFISSLVCCNALIRKYRLGQYARKTIGITQYQLGSSTGSKDHFKRKTTMKSIRIKETVTQFLERDDNSRIKADKKATVTKGKVKKQLRLLCDDLKHLYAKYMTEGQRKISYALFCKLRPFWIKAPTARDRDTCLCKIHENLKYKLETAYNENMYATKNVDDLAQFITCTNKLDKKSCMYRECPTCKDKKIPKVTENDLGRQVTWKMWKSRKIEITKKGTDGEQVNKQTNRVVKEVEQGTLETLDNEANTELQRACRHIFNIQNQYSQMKTLREKLQETDILMHVDFSENYNCKYQAEVQSVHFGASQRQVSIHTGVLYTHIDIIPFATLSDSFNHGPDAIWAHLDPVLKFINSQKNLKVVHFLSDGPTTQYRNRKNFYLLSTQIFEMGFEKATWNFLESGHGKGAADGVGAVIKRTADKAVETKSKDITCAADLARELNTLKVKIFLVNEDDIAAFEKKINQSIMSVPKTMKIHQILVEERGKILCRDLSCFCSYPDLCTCYEPVQTTFSTTPNQQQPHALMENAPINTQTSSPQAASPNNQPDVCADECLIGRYVVVNYDGLPYPGIVMDVDDNELEVKVMHSAGRKSGRNRFYWPSPVEDILWYKNENLVTVLENEPRPVTGRHMEVEPTIWRQIELQLGLE